MPNAVPKLSEATFVLRSLRYFWRTHASVAMGVAAATAVIVGALVVGDSVRGSLRGLVLDRLSSIECLLHSRTYFEPQLLDELSLPDDSKVTLAPAIILPSSTVESRRDGEFLRASQVQVLAVDASFSKQLLPEDAETFPAEIGEDEVVINAALARELNVEVGEEITLRISQTSGVPADNPLGRRDDTSESVPRQKVVAIVPDNRIGGLSFLVGQAVPRNVFASLTTIQDVLECGTRVNGSLVFSQAPSQSVDAVGQDMCDKLNLQLRPKLEDYGLALAHHRRIFPDPEIDTSEESDEKPEVVFDYYQLSSDQLIIDASTSDAVVEKFGDVAQEQITYLANSIAKITPIPSDLSPERSLAAQLAREAARRRSVGMISVPLSATIGVASETKVETLSRQVPYSIVIGVESNSELDYQAFTPFSNDEIQIPFCWINSWLADQIDAAPGDWIEVKYFEPETVDGESVEDSVRLMVAAIVPVTEPARSYRRIQPAGYATPPTKFNDPNLTPSVPGVTDQDSISNWDLPFELELEDLILPVDDKYWSDHRLTPKVFLPYRFASSATVFGSRFGKATAIRFDTQQLEAPDALRSQIEEALLTTRAEKGLIFTPIRQIQLKSASGTTPFDMLFLSLSFFVIVAALLLVALLFKLGIQARTEQLGMLAAQGFTAGRIRQVLLRELAAVSCVGAVIGILLGLAYARLMIAGLETWWVGAISSPFLRFAFTPQSLLIGAFAGMCASLLTIYLSLRKLSRAKPLSMLRGENQDSFRSSRNFSRLSVAVACMGALFACGLILAGLGQTGMARAGSFFGSGMLLLAAALIGLRQWIDAGIRRPKSRVERGSILELAWRSICRNPTRSSLCLGLLAVASFLIASMGVFQVSPNERGYGGFNLMAESSQPIYQNIAASSVRRDFLGAVEAAKLADASIVPFKARRGEDASCNNLFQVTEPTILGVPDLLQEVFDLAPTAARFDWAAAVDREHPWTALRTSATGTAQNPIPVIVDQNTAAWSLKQGGSIGATIKLEIGQREIYFLTVGLLSNSVLQGKLLIGEANFQTLFPEISGYNFFLIRSSTEKTESVAATLEKGWSDVGLDVQSSKAVLQKLLGVQNTYILAFQSLGALGLLLGTFGLVAVQVRSVVERRRELALMQALGFSQARIARMLTIETVLLLVGGLVVGIACAAVALVPYVIEVQPQLSFFNPLLMLVVVMLAGIVAALIAVRTATNQPVLASLRSE